MDTITQSGRLLEISTPLGRDELLLIGLRGTEAISELFHFDLDLLAKNKEIPFEKLLGQPVLIRLSPAGGKKRLFAGIISRFSQGKRGETFTQYRAEVVPQLWLLTRRLQSRIFQHQKVPDILKIVLSGLNVAWELQGTFEPRDYCVQYRESDFAFASRLMEEEGIYYFFKHSAAGHQMVIANKPLSHVPVPEQSTLIYEEVKGGNRDEMRITAWEKQQEIRAGKVTLWDHCFELPGKRLVASKSIQESVAVGKLTHQLKLGSNEPLELYDFPGGYAQRFDGVDKGGAVVPAELQKIFQDNKRTAEIRMQQEASGGLRIVGGSNCYLMSAGHRFTLTRHFNADGDYSLTSVAHDASMAPDYRSGQGDKLIYKNTFTCIPIGLPFRPASATPRPHIDGTQTAIVVGPSGEEIFTDKYGRVKVQFHWDRQGKYDPDSSCWVRVAQAWAGKRWGASFFPRIGQEVVVSFLEGDPDQPIITGSVYNAESMPPYLGDGPDSKHPNDNKLSGIKTNSTPGGSGYNELRFDDTQGKEQVFVHAQNKFELRAKKDQLEWVGQDQHRIVTRDQLEQVGGDHHRKVTGDENKEVGGTVSLTSGADLQVKVGKNYAVAAATEIHLKSGNNLVLEAQQITLKVGGNFIAITPAGVAISGTMIMLNSGGAAGAGAGASPEKAKAPKEADKAETGTKNKSLTGTAANADDLAALSALDLSAPTSGGTAGQGAGQSPGARALQNAAKDGKPTCEICEKAKQLKHMLMG